MTIIYRTTGAWGAGKGSALTKGEGDSNIYQIVTRVAALESSLPAAAIGISAITVTGDQMSVTLSNLSTQGPFTLPTTTYTYKGAWAALITYAKYDRVTNNGNLYEVLYPHTSAATFDPNANDGIGHNYYALILSNPGASFPTGGPTGYLLAKNSSTNFDVGWLNPTGISLPFSSITGTISAAQLPNPTGSTLGGVKSLSAVANKFLTSIGTNGLPVAAQPDFTDISGTISLGQLPTLPSPPLPVHAAISGNTTLDLTHADEYTPVSSSGAVVLTIPPFASVAWIADTEMTFRMAGTGSVTIVGGVGVTLDIPVGFLAKSFGQGATITIKNTAVNTWDIWGLLAMI